MIANLQHTVDTPASLPETQHFYIILYQWTVDTLAYKDKAHLSIPMDTVLYIYFPGTPHTACTDKKDKENFPQEIHMGSV